MKFGTEFKKLVRRSCNHQESFDFAYSNQRMRFQQEVLASRTLCSSCRIAIESLAETTCSRESSNEAVWLAKLPELTGKPDQIKWAKNIRSKAGAYYFSLLDHVVCTPEMPLSGVRSALRLLFSISSSHFWIEARADLLTPAWLVSEVELLSRMSDSMAAPVPATSAYGFWKRVKPDYVAAARKSMKGKGLSAAA